MTLALVARGVSLTYGTVAALQDVTVDIPAGGAVALVGESGSGKTTLLRCFNRTVAYHRGEVLVDGMDVTATDPVALRRRLGYVPQNGGLLPHWTVLQNVGLVLRATGRPTGTAVEALTLVGLDVATFGGRYPHQLSGGQRQRVALARALAAGPGALLLDEPFGALDAISKADVQESFADLRRQLPITTLLVTHDLAEAARLADTIVVMRGGRVEQTGSIADLRDTPATAYVRALVGSALSQARALGPA